MKRIRIIPLLLFEKGGLAKTKVFNNPTYVGDPINAIKIFNEKEVDELIFIDIEATRLSKAPNIQQLSEIASECFMPLCYGGGITTIDQIKQILHLGVEKVCLGTIAHTNPELVTIAASKFGNQSIVISIDIKTEKSGKQTVFVSNGKISTGMEPIEYSQKMEQLGAGELLIQSINHDGMQNGYNLEVIEAISKAVSVPVIACSGAKNLSDVQLAIEHGASAAAAGSMFVFYGKYNAVLINTPSESEIHELNKIISH